MRVLCRSENHDGTYLVDEGLLDNLPVEAMCALPWPDHRGDVSLSIDLEQPPAASRRRSGIYRMLSRLRAPARMPSFGQMLMRTATLSSVLASAMRGRSASGGTLNTVIGDPQAARQSVGRFRDCGVDELILIMQMGTVPHEVVMRSIRTFAEKVMPFFGDAG